MADGVWRTIKGRRVFIEEGQSLTEAMKKSGKFKDIKKENKKDDNKHRIDELEKQKENAKGFFEKGKIQEEIDALKNGYKNVEEYRKFKEEQRDKLSKQAEKERQERRKLADEQNSKTNGNEEYMMAHRPNEDGATLTDISKENEGSDYTATIPSDFYEHPEWYCNMNDISYKESFEVIKSARNNPDKEIYIYRATTGDKINKGDWITLSESYATHHKNSWLDGNGKVLKMKVKVKDVRFAGDDINEFGYYPQK